MSYLSETSVSTRPETQCEHHKTTKTCHECGEHAKSNSARKCWNCAAIYLRKTAHKLNDGRGKKCKCCAECGAMATGNNAKKCLECGAAFLTGAKKRKRALEKSVKQSRQKVLRQPSFIEVEPTALVSAHPISFGNELPVASDVRIPSLDEALGLDILNSGELCGSFLFGVAEDLDTGLDYFSYGFRL